MTVLDLFAGVGVGLALRSMGLDELGLDSDPAVCALRLHHGLRSVGADVAALDPGAAEGAFDGLWASPPCQAFSVAGKRQGVAMLGALCRAVRAGEVPDTDVCEPLRWTLVLRPEWVAWEQVPPVLPLWRACAEALERARYHAWAGVLDAADVGTPQHRRRAILMAHRDRPIRAPEATHGRPGLGRRLLGAPLEPWVSMGAALVAAGLWTEAGEADDLARTVCGARTPRWCYDGRLADGRRGVAWSTDEASRTVTSAAGRGGGWILDRRQSHGGPSELGDPAPSVTGACERNQWQLVHPGRSYSERQAVRVTEPSPTVALGHDARSWVWEQPATTVQGTPRVAPPGHHETQFEDGVPLSVPELCVLQELPPDLFQGTELTKTARARIIGNAVPASLCRAVVGALIGS